VIVVRAPKVRFAFTTLKYITAWVKVIDEVPADIGSLVRSLVLTFRTAVWIESGVT
jgi:hypothetical protein